MPRLTISIPNPTDATSFYRGIGPLGELLRRYDNLRWVTIQSHDWSSTEYTDCLFMQRPHTKDELIVALMYKENSIPLWIDYDDDLLCVPTDNPTYPIYSKSIDNIKKLLSLADVVTVSTNALQKRYSEFNKNVIVVPNAFNSRRFKHKIENPKPRKKIIAWRGSKTHTRDCLSQAEVIIKLANEYKDTDWQWHFIGDIQWQLTDHMPHEKTIWSEGMDIISYHNYIYELAPAVFIVPLEDNEFNQSKSNINWIEATMAGSATIAPLWEEWNQSGIMPYENTYHFESNLRSILNEKALIEQRVKFSRDIILNDLTLEKVNTKRVEILENFLGKKL